MIKAISIIIVVAAVLSGNSCEEPLRLEVEYENCSEPIVAEIIVLDEERGKGIFYTCAVAENGDFAIAMDVAEGVGINIYSSKGRFRYGYIIKTDDNILLYWDEEKLVMFFVNQRVAATYDEEGICVESHKVKETQYNDQYEQFVLRRGLVTPHKDMARVDCFILNQEKIYRVNLLTGGGIVAIYEADITFEFLVYRLIDIVGFMSLPAIVIVILLLRKRNKKIQAR